MRAQTARHGNGHREFRAECAVFRPQQKGKPCERRPVKNILESLYRRYSKPECIPPDPLQFVVGYEDVRQRELAALVASSLAFGRVAHILTSLRAVFGRMGNPRLFVMTSGRTRLRRTFAGFRHRFVGERELVDLMLGMRRVCERYGCLGSCLTAHVAPGDRTVTDGLANLVDELRAGGSGELNYLLPSPRDGSACKRLNLFLRWMVRHDAVDPGGWEHIGPGKLVVPLDTHMHRMARSLGMTHRKQADLRTAIEVTEAFRRIVPDDPVRYDFALTRIGIHGGKPPCAGHWKGAFEDDEPVHDSATE